MALDRNFAGPVIITSTQGGSNIEEIAAENPDAIIRYPIDITTGLSREGALNVAERLGFHNEARDEVNSRHLVECNRHFLFVPGSGYHAETIQAIHHKRHRSIGNQPFHRRRRWKDLLCVTFSMSCMRSQFVCCPSISRHGLQDQCR